MIQPVTRKLRYGRVVFLLACIICLVCGITFVLAKPDPYKEYKNVSEEMKKAGEQTQRIEDDSDDREIFLHYPKFDQDTIDKEIQAYVDKLPITTGISFLDYESHEALEHYVSITFTFKNLTMEHEIVSEKKTFMNFEKESGKKLVLSDVLRRDYKDLINTEASKQSIDIQDMDALQFSIQDSGIQIYTDQEKEISIPYETQKKYIKLPEKSIAETVVEVKKERTIDPDKPMIALTFDDGPSPYTNDFINTLSEHGAAGTFFMLGTKIEENPEIVRHMVEEGMEIANHSWDHKNTNSDDAAFIRHEIYDTQDALFRITGHEAKQFRPPYGDYNELTSKIANEEDVEIALWNVDTEDWSNRDASITLERARAGKEDAAIILFHDLYPTSLEAIETLVPELQADGYQLVTLSELLEAKGK